ncbi:c-type cytochrome [Bacteroidota bacterium]
MNGSNLLLTASAFGLVLVLTLSACLQPNSHDRYAEDGRIAYQKNCASCHGPDATGGGPLAAELEKPVPDLTLLSSRYDGVFPSEYILGTIDGRQEFLAHGTRTMPIWGNIWRPGAQDTHEGMVEAQRTMNGLLHYLEAVQVPVP